MIGHFSQRYQAIEPFAEEAASVFPNVIAVQDGDRVPMPARADADAG